MSTSTTLLTRFADNRPFLLDALLVCAFSSDALFIITKPVIGMCNLIRTIGRSWYNIVWLDASIRRQLGAIPSVFG